MLPKAFCGRFIAVDSPPEIGGAPHMPWAVSWGCRITRADIKMIDDGGLLYIAGRDSNQGSADVPKEKKKAEATWLLLLGL